MNARFPIAVLVGMLSSPSAASPWAPDGNPVCTNTAYQYQVRSCTDGQGGVFVAFYDNRAGAAIYVQHLTVNGSVYPGWPADGKQVSVVNVAAEEPAIVEDGNDGFYVAWKETPNPLVPLQTQIRMQRLTHFGNIPSPWTGNGVAVNTAGGCSRFPELVRSGNSVLVAWRWSQTGNPAALDWWVRGQRVGIDGSVMWSGSPQGVVMGTLLTKLDLSGRFQADGTGGAFYAWTLESNTANEWDVALQRILPSGSIASGWPGSGFLVCDLPGLQAALRVFPDGTGGCTAIWQDHRDGLNAPDLYYLRMGPDSSLPMGFPEDGAYLPIPGAAVRYAPELAVDSNYAVILYLRPAGGIFADRIDINGQSQWPSPVALTLATSISNVRTVPDGTGGALVSWTGGGGLSPTWNIYAQTVSPGGKITMPLGGIFLCDADSAQVSESMVPSGVAGAIVSFSDYRNPGADPDVYAQYFQGYSNISTLPPEGWTFSITPKDAPNAVPYDVPPNPILPGNGLTYLNWTFTQAGPNPMPETTARLLLDYEPILGETLREGVAPSVYQLLNQGPVVVRGGRHALHMEVDVNDVVPESDEFDNVVAEQWVWSPLNLVKQEPQLRPLPPDPIGFVQPNADGFAFTRNPTYAWVVAAAPRNTSGDDYDLFVYDDYSSSMAGFSNLRQISNWPTQYTDFVVGHYSGTPTTLFPAVVRFSAFGGGDDFGMEWTDAEGRNAGSAGSFTNQMLDQNRLADVYEAYLNRGETCTFVLARTSGSDDISFEVFPGFAGGIYGRGAGLPPSPVGPANDALTYTASETGWHPIVVYRPTGTPPNPIIYNFSWGPGTVGVSSESALPERFMFRGALTNPVRARTAFAFSLPKAGVVRLDVFDVAGRKVSTLVDESLAAGNYQWPWNPREHPLGAGIYFARLTYDDDVLVRRLTLLP